jgi:hypothetical protein
MANLDTPFGFKPVGHLLGVPWSAKIRTYYVPATDATAMFKGDAVKSAGSADATGKFPTVAQAAATNVIRGVIVGFGDNPHVGIHPDNPTRDYRPASTAMYVFVVDDPFVIFEIQEDSVGNAIDADMVGLSTDITVGTGSTSTGKSAMELDSSDTATALGQCKILRLVDREDNVLGNHAKWEVLIVEHEMLAATDV